LKCFIAVPSQGVKITEAAFAVGAAAPTACTIAAGGQSFQLPISVVGAYTVGVTVDNIPAPGVVIAEGSTAILFLLPGNVAKNGIRVLNLMD
jgi:hypothetical protein